MLLIDGVRYHEWTPDNEDEFEHAVGQHANELFGANSQYFDLKHKLTSLYGTGSIPDGYVIAFGSQPKLHIIEFELASHSIQHIVTQIIAISNGIENPKTQQAICNTIEDEIVKDDILNFRLLGLIKPLSVHRFISDCFVKKQLQINIIIDKKLLALDEALNKINYPKQIIEFRTFKREDADTVHVHLFPVQVGVRQSPTFPHPPPPPPPPPPTADGVLDITINTPSFVKYNLIYIPKNSRDFFPGYRVPFELQTDIGNLETYVCAAPAGTQVGDLKAGVFFQSNLFKWYKKHTSIKIGDKVRITQIEPMKKYKLEIV